MATNSANKQLNNILSDMTRVSLALNPNSKLANVAKIMVDQMQAMQPQEIMPSSLVAAAQQYSGDVSPAVMTGLANFLYNAYKGYNSMKQQKQLNAIVQSELAQQEATGDLEKQRQKYLQILDRAKSNALTTIRSFVVPVTVSDIHQLTQDQIKLLNSPEVTQAQSEIESIHSDASTSIINATTVDEMKNAYDGFITLKDDIVAKTNKLIQQKLARKQL